MVEKSYFKKFNKDYMQTADWVQMWRKALDLDYVPICDIRKVCRSKENIKQLLKS